MIACGTCTDGAILLVAPFMMYWLILFIAWSLLVGVPLSLIAYAKRVHLPMRPLVYFLVALGLIVVLLPLTMGSALFPMVFFLPIWIFRLYKSLKKFVRKKEAPTGLVKVALQAQRIAFVTSLALIPVAYLRVFVLGYAHWN